MGGWFSSIIRFFFDAQQPQEERMVQGPQATNYPSARQTVSKETGEQEFFQFFFMALDQIPGYQGILGRWQEELRRVQTARLNRYDLSNVWPDRCGYVGTLRKVRKLVSNQAFSRYRQCLAELASGVVRQRKDGLDRAKRYNYADTQHQTVLEEWQAVRNSLHNLLLEVEKRALW
ncbi:hypothetical protein chiPu_0023672 [Chiloscyllium punctatum]|uniref:Uncharacterized protein n=1 Tax=Chiloscyllium punctatum TaxID=137246 RepID=A0A401TBB8_CHIPU|nr:hypothetical protein [Chiloscyllium punctatum]